MFKIIISVLIALLAIMLATPQIARSSIEASPVMETKVHTTKTLESEINRLAVKYKQNATLAKEIIRCEGLMYKKEGNNINYDKKGVAWSEDVGWWQINDYYNKADAKRRGYNIYNEWQNLEYGFIMLKKQGTTPWNASKNCWLNS